MGSYRFTVSMKIKDGGSFFATYPKATANFNSLLDLNGITRDISQGKLEAIGQTERGVNNWKNNLQDFWLV